jgi:hypothetical protein
VVVWDTEDRATAFARDYARVLARKLGSAATAAAPTLETWPSGPVSAAVERRHRSVLLIEGAPTSLVDTLRATVWATPVLY